MRGYEAVESHIDLFVLSLQSALSICPASRAEKSDLRREPCRWRKLAQKDAVSLILRMRARVHDRLRVECGNYGVEAFRRDHDQLTGENAVELELLIDVGLLLLDVGRAIDRRRRHGGGGGWVSINRSVSRRGMW